jgi:spindle assembly abnormal protein 6
LITPSLKFHTPFPQPSRSRVISIEITDESDPFFHHSLILTEVDFAALRDDQSLLVDFSSFPDMLIALLRSTSSSSDIASREYSCILTVRGDPTPGGTSCMSIVQTNHFKNLTHLSLQLRLATDASLKRYLAARLTYTKELLVESNASLINSLGASKKFSSLAESRLADLTTLQSELEKHVNSLTSKHALELAEAKAVAQSERADAELSFRRAHEALVVQHEAITAEAQANEARVRTELQSVQAELSMTKIALQTALNSESILRGELATKSEEIRYLHDARVTSSFLESKSSKESMQLTTRCAILEQQVSDQRELLTRSQAQANQSEQLCERLEEDVGIYKALYEKNQEKLERSVKEIEKGNEVISRLDESVRAKTDQLKQLQDRLAERERTVLAIQREVDNARSTLERERQSREASEAALELSKNHLKQARETLAGNEQVIAWLNKELREATSAIGDKHNQQAIVLTETSQLSPFMNAANVASRKAVSTFVASASDNVMKSLPVKDSSSPSFSFFSTMIPSKSPATIEQTSLSKTGSVSISTEAVKENPYLSGNIPLAEMLQEMKASGFTVNASTILESKKNASYLGSIPTNISSGVPGGGR